MNNPIQQFRDALTSRNIVPPAKIVPDGKIHRCDAEGKGGKKDAAYLLHMDGIPAGGFENHRDGLGWQKWRADMGRPLTPSEEAESRQKIEEARRKREAEEEKQKGVARENACLILADSDFVHGAEHAYLKRKGVNAHGIKISHAYRLQRSVQDLSNELQGLLLIVPIKDSAGGLHSIQFITEEGQKRYLKDGRKQGCYFPIGEVHGVLCIAEGFATGASIHEASGHAVAVAFDSSNLLPVAQALREKYPDLLLVLCADDDQNTPDNPGVTQTRKAAQAVGGCVAIPDFGDNRPEGVSDFNDLHQAQGLAAVERCINAAIQAAQTPQVPLLPHPIEQGEASLAEPIDPKDSSKAISTYQYGSGHFEASPGGVFYIGADKDGKARPKKWLCSPLYVVAVARDKKGEGWAHLLEWYDLDQVRHQWAMPLELLQCDGLEVRSKLASGGLRISPEKYARELLVPYLQTCTADTMVRCVDRLGWHGGVYVRSNNEVIGKADEIIIFQNTQAIEPALSVSNTAEQWRNTVGALAVGNSRLVFAVSVAFAGVLADLVGEDSGGFNLRGTSSTGKSSALNIAASVWGDPRAYMHLWRATANGLEGLAALHNDNVLILDELNQMDAKGAGEAIYMLANGQGKVRASKTGAARQSASWRLMFLSSGGDASDQLS